MATAEGVLERVVQHRRAWSAASRPAAAGSRPRATCLAPARRCRSGNAARRVGVRRARPWTNGRGSAARSPSAGWSTATATRTASSRPISSTPPPRCALASPNGGRGPRQGRGRGPGGRPQLRGGRQGGRHADGERLRHRREAGLSQAPPTFPHEEEARGRRGEGSLVSSPRRASGLPPAQGLARGITSCTSRPRAASPT